MARYSGRRLNDLGDFDSCNDLEEARYLLIHHERFLNIMLGLCVPASCGVEDLEELMFGGGDGGEEN